MMTFCRNERGGNEEPFRYSCRRFLSAKIFVFVKATLVYHQYTFIPLSCRKQRFSENDI